MPFFTLNFYSKGLILAILLALGIWNQKFGSVTPDTHINALAAKHLKPNPTANILAPTINKF